MNFRRVVAVEALDIIRRNWTSQNSQFESLLKWVDQPGRHPCNISNMNYDSSEFEGDWVGVFCTMLLRESNSTGYYYEASVTQFMYVPRVHILLRTVWSRYQ